MSGDPGPRPLLAWWLRPPLALAAAAGLAALANRRPALPALFGAIRQSRAEEIQGTLALLAWLLLVLICLALAWQAFRSPRQGQPKEPGLPPPSPRRRRQPALLLPSSPELRVLFATPRLAPLTPPAAPGEAEPISPATGSTRPAGDPGAAAPRMLRLYGPLSVDGSDEIGLGQRPTRGLIAYLALKRGPASSDELLEALWPGQVPASTRSRLWKATHQARALLGEALQRRAGGYQLDRRTLRCDSDEIERLQQDHPDLDQLERAPTLIVGEPLADIDYPWAEGERRRLQALKADTLATAVAARLEHGDRHSALAGSEQLIELDPLNEQGWRLAMQAEAALGRRQAVLDRYQELRRELDERLGLRPGAETRDTYHRLLRQE